MKDFYIDNQKDGSVRYRLKYNDPLTGKAKRLSYSMPAHSVRNQRKAEQILSEKLAAILSPNSGDRLLSEVMSAYLSDMSLSWRQSTYDRNAASLGRILRVFPADTILKNITPQIWRSKLSELSAHGDAGTYNEYLKRVKAFLRWSFANDYLDTQIADKLSRKTEEKDERGESRATDKYLEPKEAAALVESMKDMTRWHQLTRFMLLSGLRCGEALALNDADVGKEYISVRKTLNANHLTIGLPKTPKSNRDVAITPELAEVIAEIRKYNQWLKVSLGIRSDLFFFSEAERGQYIRYNGFNKYLHEKSLKVIGKPITTHWLRHTHASFLLAAGIPIDVISRRLGHESIEITQRVYLHIIDALKKRDADVLSGVRLLGSAPEIVDLTFAANL